MINAERQQKIEEGRTLPKNPVSSSSLELVDNRKEIVLQGKMINAIQCARDPNEVLAIKDLPSFLQFQNELQPELTSMDGLQSVGIEFEFASFKKLGQDYTQEEIIPSHIPMAKSNPFINYFKLPWSLESDSMNTLELVTPPFIYPHIPDGFKKSKEMQAIMKDKLQSISLAQPPFPEVVKLLSTLGMGKNWFYSTEYENYTVIPNQKSRGKVYEQSNVSMFPEEIAQCLKVCFDSYTDKEMVKGDIPVYLALSVKDILKSHLPKPTPGVENAINVFARYASNAISIPAMLDRQQTGVRKDPMPTTIKETFGIWIKTDAVNLLKSLLPPTDIECFIKILADVRGEVLQLFIHEKERMLATVRQEIENAIRFLSEERSKKIATIFKDEKDSGRTPNYGNIRKLVITAEERIIKEEWEPKIGNMEGYTTIMYQEVDAFITRALGMATHIETNPKETTEDFLKEKYGTGEGVRKGTYLPSIPTKDGPMYVTELR